MAATTADGVTVNGEIKKMITLISSDGESFETTEAAAAMSSTIANMIEDDCVDESGVRLPNVAARILAKVLEYCNKHAAAEKANYGDSKDATSASEDLASFDAKFVDKDDMDTLYNLLLAANFLDIKGLLDLCAQATADIIKVKKVEEIRQKFGIQNDFTKEEEQEIRNENRWAFE